MELVCDNGQIELDCCGLSSNKEKMSGMGLAPGRPNRVHVVENLGLDLWLSYPLGLNEQAHIPH